MKLMDMKSQRQAALDKADAILKVAENGNRDLTASEKETVDLCTTVVTTLNPQIQAVESKNTLSSALRALGGVSLLGGGRITETSAFTQPIAPLVGLADTRHPEYAAALHSFLTTGGKAHGEELTAGADGQGGYRIPFSELYTRQRHANGSFPKMDAALYEGSGGGSTTSGGYAISIPTVDQIVPLALPDLGIFDASLVLPTASDIKVPVAASFGRSALKSESTGTIATFGGSDPTLGQVTLSAFMAGALRMASWELLQDVNAFQQFVVDDLLKGQRILEDQLLATGTGTNQAQGVFGNTGTGTGAAYQLTGAATDGQLLLDSLFDVTATLKGAYQANACWIMSRATGLAIRRAQMQANLFVPVSTVDADGTERILGKPVFYDVNAPALPTATSAGVVPILYGDFKQGYIVGVRGGAGISVKILDQPWAAQGQLGILAYRRLDARVRRSEAIQAVKISHS